MKEFKIKVLRPELSEIVQRRLFELGYAWTASNKNEIFETKDIWIEAKNKTLYSSDTQFVAKYPEIQIADLWSDMFEEKKGEISLLKVIDSFSDYANQIQMNRKKINELVDKFNEREHE